MADILSLVNRVIPPQPWLEGDNIPWDEPGFSKRMLAEHLDQAHDLASRRESEIGTQVTWIHERLLLGEPTRVLDLACGPGLYLLGLARLGHRGLGVDFSPAAIAYGSAAAEQAGLAVEFIEADLREVALETGFGLAMMLYGQLNVFPRPVAAALVARAVATLEPGGTFLAEPQRFDHVRNTGAATPTWSAAHSGLFSATPHLLLTESFWDDVTRTTTERFHAIDAATATVTSHAMSSVAYGDAELEALLSGAGLVDVTLRPALGDTAVAETLLMVTGRKPGNT
jgi:SAM-dependent methyltransferase